MERGELISILFCLVIIPIISLIVIILNAIINQLASVNRQKVNTIELHKINRIYKMEPL